jgi:RNA polymerase primary sigma factor
VIVALCKSPLTFQAIIIWRHELMNAKIPLRDNIDFEATHEGPEANRRHRWPWQSTWRRPPAASAELAVGAEDGAEGSVEGELDEEEEYKNAPSLAAIEAELKPKVLETLVRHDVLPRSLCPRSAS